MSGESRTYCPQVTMRKQNSPACLVAKTDFLVAMRNVAPLKVIHIWLDKEVLWIRVIKVLSNYSPQQRQMGKRFLMTLGNA